MDNLVCNPTGSVTVEIVTNNTVADHKPCLVSDKKTRVKEELNQHAPVKPELLSDKNIRVKEDLISIEEHAPVKSELLSDSLDLGDHSTRKRKVFTISDKVLIIRDLERGKSQSKLARELDIQQSTVSRMWKNRNKIISAYQNDQLNSKRLRHSTNKALDDSLTQWIELQRRQTPRILRPKTQELAISISARNICDGWLLAPPVKNKVELAGTAVNGTASHATVVETSADWLSHVWPTLRKEYLDHNIFHLDETGLFFRLSPDKTTVCLGEQCFGGKLASERLTVVLTTNMTGSEKRRIIVVGKQENTKIPLNSRHVRYVSNSKAWMCAEIFESELRRWDHELEKQNRKILLLVNDCSAHPNIKDLNRIKLVYLPYRVAAVRQPMGRGIFRSFKTQYRRQLLLFLLQFLETRTTPVITVNDAARMIYIAWLRVPVGLIKNCFLQSGLMKAANGTDMFQEYEDDLSMSEWLKQFNLNHFDEWKNTIDWYVEVDCEVQTSQEIDETESCDEEEPNDADPTDKQDNHNNDTEEKTVTVASALNALREVAKFFEQQNSLSTFNQVLSIENTLEKMILNTQKSKVQTS